MVKEYIEIVTVMKDKLSGVTKKINKEIKELNRGVIQTNTQVRRWNKGILDTNRVTTQTTRGLKKFQYEWLSIMFLGMAINRMFGQHVKGALEMMGATELLTEALKLSVFTAFEPLLNTIIEAIAAFYDLPEPVQKAIGWFIIIATAIGGFLFLLGTIKLGIMGVTAAFGGGAKGAGILSGAFKSLGAIGTKVAAALGLGLGGLLAILAVIVVAVVGMVLAWKENFMNMKQTVTNFINAIKQMFGGFFNVLKGIVQFFIAIFKGDFEGAKQAFKNIVNGMKDFFIGGFTAMFNFFKMIAIGLIRIGWGIGNTLFDAIRWAVVKIKNVLASIVDFARKIWNAIIDIFRKPVTAVVNVFRRESSYSRRQYGGPVSKGLPYLVGERGPELFIPNIGGRVSPQGKSEIIIAPVYNITVSDRSEFENLIKRNNDKLVEDVRRLIQA